MAEILIIDDEEGIREILSEILSDEGYTTATAADGKEAIALIESKFWDLVFLDVWLPGKGGLEILEILKEKRSDLPVIMISGHASIENAVKAVKLGAYDFIEKPLSLDRILQVAEKALNLQQLKKENSALKNVLFIEDQMIGSSLQMMGVHEKIQQAADCDARVLIQGENGTGKELVARAIHLKSARSNQPFIEVNCAAIPDSLIESELFGHEKGAFTGAVSTRKGRWELADGGTLFLDEIGDLSQNAQAKVLRAVQEMRFQRVGGENTIEVDVRIVAATNKNLQTETAEGRFREDLYFRLNVLQITLPALRERKDDIPELSAYFLGKFLARDRRQNLILDDEAVEVLKSHPWPGNIRELRNVCERISVTAEGPVVDPGLVREHIGAIPATSIESAGPYAGMVLSEAKIALEKVLILQALTEKKGNLTKAAQQLGLYPGALHARMKKLGIERE